MALWANLLALLFGNWQAVHPALFKDSWIVLYISFGTTFLPTLITVLLQKYIKPLTVSFIYILEPVLGALVAYLYLHETMSVYGYIGGGFIVVGTLINTWGTAQRPVSMLTMRQRLASIDTYLQTSLLGTLGYPLLCSCLGIVIVYKLGGFPPAAWRTLYHLRAQLPVYLHQEPVSLLLLCAQALSWLVAWLSLSSMGMLTTYRALGRLFFTSHAPMPVRKSPGPRHIATYAYPAAHPDRVPPVAQQRRRTHVDIVKFAE